MQGRRVYVTKSPTEENPYPLPDDPHPGDYWKDPNTDQWLVYCPQGGIGNVSKHTVIEHEDNTITVSPSILLTYGPADEAGNRKAWHGYLERGVWRDA